MFHSPQLHSWMSKEKKNEAGPTQKNLRTGHQNVF